MKNLISKHGFSQLIVSYKEPAHISGIEEHGKKVYHAISSLDYQFLFHKPLSSSTDWNNYCSFTRNCKIMKR
jgi:hypothetical protein